MRNRSGVRNQELGVRGSALGPCSTPQRLSVSTPQRFSVSTPQRPRGITLFEVVLALAIFLGAIATLTQILSNGARANVRARLASEAALRAESQMNEVVAGSLPLQSVTSTPFEDNPQWVWSLNIVESEVPDLLELQMGVQFLRSDGTPAETFQLTRLMRDPQVFADAALATTGDL